METQDTVSSWGKETFPQDSLKDKVRMLIEEASELAVATGTLSLEEAIDATTSVWKELGHLPKGMEHVASGIADVQISLFVIADDQKLSVQKCLDEKMSQNRSRGK